jgi:hypothetical protein
MRPALGTLEVVSWPHPGRHPRNQWWVVERRPGGLTPIHGPYQTKRQADVRRDVLLPEWERRQKMEEA